MSYVERGHLGGYKEGGDPATFYPDLWRWLVEEREVRSVIDVGCGEGHAVEFFESLGCDVLGIDGVEQENPSVVRHDFTEGAFTNDRAAFVLGVPGDRSRWLADLCWSCEFVEHVEERFAPNFLETFASARLVLMTHAEPGQAGYHHVNCQPEAYWRGALAAIGFELDPEMTSACRQLAALNESPWNHFKRSGLAFRRAA